MKLYRSLNMIFLIIFIIGTVLCFKYLPREIALFMQKKDPIYETIMTLKSDYEITSLNAYIYDNYIIPGVVGKEVNVLESFRNMKYDGVFQEDALVFNEVAPEITLQDHKDKIIEQGNKIHQAVALITQDEQLITYLEEMGISYAVLTTTENVNIHREHGIKVNYDISHYQEVEKILKENKEDNDLCYIRPNHEEFCKSVSKTLIKETLSLSKSDFPRKYSQVASGNILYLENNLGLQYLKLLLEQIRYKGLKIIPLNELVSEGV